MSELFKIYKDTWVKIFGFFSDSKSGQIPDLPFELTFVIFGVFAALAAWLCIHTMVVNGRLSVLNKKLKKIIGNSRETWQKNFRNGFGDIETHIQDVSFLRRSWQEFDESIIRPDPDRVGDVFRNTVRANAYFSLSGLARSAKLPMHFWQALPNYFVGFGLLFTFLGLAAALYAANEGVASLKIEDAQESLKHLLHAATFKFLTSITGLAASIMFSMLFKWRMGRLRHSISELCDTLEKGLVFCTHEDIALQQLAEIKKQTPLLEWFKADFAVSVAAAMQNKMNETLPAALSESMKPLAEVLLELASNLGRMNMNGLEQMVTRFTEKLQGGAGSEMMAIARTLEDMRGVLSHVAEQMRQGGQQAGERIEAATAQLEAIIAHAGSGFGANMQQAAEVLQESIHRTMSHLQNQLVHAGQGVAGQLSHASARVDEALTPFADQMAALTATMQNFGQEANRQQQELRSTAASIQDIVQGVGTMLGRLQGATAPIAQTSAQFEATARAIQNAAVALESTQQELGGFLNTIQDSNQKLAQTWQNYHQRFEHIDEHLAKTFSGLADYSAAQLDTFKRYANELDSHLHTAMSSLAGGIEQLSEVIEELAEQRKTAA